MGAYHARKRMASITDVSRALSWKEDLSMHGGCPASEEGTTAVSNPGPCLRGAPKGQMWTRH